MIGFRVDANKNIATGHLMRCMSIALAVKRLEGECLFLLAEDIFTEPLQEAGLPYHILGSRWNHLEEELPNLISLVKEISLDWLVVDSYQVTEPYLGRLNQEVPVLYIDDEKTRLHPVSALLRYSDWEQSVDTRILSGMAYVPLREEFYPKEDLGVKGRAEGKCAVLHNQENLSEGVLGRQAGSETVSVLVTTGGTDPFHIERRLMETWLLQKTNYESKMGIDLSFHFIVGAMAEEQERLKDLEDRYPFFHLHRNVKHMGDLMRQADFAVSAGGSTLFELCACGVPTVCFSFADNQAGFVKELEEHGIMQCVGDARERKDICEEILKRLFYYIENKESAKNYSKRMKELVDGKGAERIAEVLLMGKEYQ
ncbi:UDP-2,4-diacetamido-2,4,6-trideoxy-beta-L-altropyranose hydrolase [Clostridia bacterium]|nr:UDP-2,4-diacetamido-2,4,6-trideoxy-beta-L-altropyranose hydrolase [Clostridia bacterium]